MAGNNDGIDLLEILSSTLPSSSPSPYSDGDIFGISTINPANAIISTIKTPLTTTTAPQTLASPAIPVPMTTSATISRTIITILTQPMPTTTPFIPGNGIASKDGVTTKATTPGLLFTPSLSNSGRYTDEETLNIAVGYTVGGFAILLLTALLFIVRRVFRKDNSKKVKAKDDPPVTPRVFDTASELADQNWRVPRPNLRTTSQV